MCIFISLSVKAVHLELVSDISTDAFIACLRRFISQRGKPTILWNDHGTNFVGAASETKELVKFLESQKAQGEFSTFTMVICPRTCTPLWWAVGSRSEELQITRTPSRWKCETDFWGQIEACLNSWPLVVLPSDDDGIEALTHEGLLRPSNCLSVYLCSLSLALMSGTHSSSLVSQAHLQVAHDIVILKEDNMIPTKWPLARVTGTCHYCKNFYRHVPVTKVVLLPTESSDWL